MIRSPAVATCASLLAFSLGMSACSTTNRSVDMARLGPAHQLQIYDGGRLILDRAVAANSAEEQAVATWLYAHADGWQPTFVTYAPGRSIRGANFNLNFTKNRCVLNYRANDQSDWVQLDRPIRPDEKIPVP